LRHGPECTAARRLRPQFFRFCVPGDTKNRPDANRSGAKKCPGNAGTFVNPCRPVSGEIIPRP
jgi:hypothetical protein